MTRTVTGTIRAGVNWSGRYVRECIRIDTRSLAVFRILLGSLVIADVLLRSRNFSVFYSGEGLVPQSLAMEMTDAFSLYYFASSPTQIAFLMGLQVLLAIQLIVGYETRLATILSFLFVVSLDHHNPLVLSYADTLFRLLFFWAIFLPLGERWSIDAVHADRAPRPSFAGIASFLAMGQMVLMYTVNWYHKSQNDLWTGGTATPKIMGLDDMTFFLAGYVREFPTLLQYGGLLWYYMLMGSILLIVLVGRFRYPLLVLFVGGHATFAVTVRIGAFAYVAITGLVLFCQPQLWRDAATLARTVGIDPERLTAQLARLERLAERVPRLHVDSLAVSRAKRTLYNVGIGAIVVSLVVFSLFTFSPIGAIVGDSVVPEEQIEDTAAILSVDQPAWSVFAPNPRTTDRYYVFAAETVTGDRIDVYNDGRELTADRPYEGLQKQYDTYRERFYMNSVRRGASAGNDVPKILAEHHCTAWEDEHGTELTSISMYLVEERITMETIAEPAERETRTRHMYDHSCDGAEPVQIDLPGS